MLALSLSARERGELASKLIRSLGTPFDDDEDDDDGIEEALRRSQEMDEDPDSVMTYEDVLSGLKSMLHENNKG